MKIKKQIFVYIEMNNDNSINWNERFLFKESLILKNDLNLHLSRFKRFVYQYSLHYLLSLLVRTLVHFA